MTNEKIKRMFDAFYQAKRIRDKGVRSHTVSDVSAAEKRISSGHEPAASGDISDDK